MIAIVLWIIMNSIWVIVGMIIQQERDAFLFNTYKDKLEELEHELIS